MKVSGVISTLGQESFIQNAIESLVDQVDELIVVDDGGVTPLSGIDPRVKLIRHETPQGVSNSYNEAIEFASGELIIVQGGDDISLPNRRLLQESFATSGRILHSKPMIIDSLGRSLENNVAGEFFHTDTHRNLLENLYFTGNMICAPSVAFLKSDFHETGGFLPEVQYLQDYALWLSFCDLGMTFFETEPIVKYRKHSNNLSGESSALLSQVKSRFTVEELFVLERFVNLASDATLRQLARKIGIAVEENFDKTHLKLQISINHKNKLVRQNAIMKIFTLIVENKHAFHDLHLNRNLFKELISDAFVEQS